MVSLYDMISLSQSDIQSLSKDLILRKFHKLIKLWYINKTLPESMLGDADIYPYYTPCWGHSTLNDGDDEFDGPRQMQAYCLKCKKS